MKILETSLKAGLQFKPEKTTEHCPHLPLSWHGMKIVERKNDIAVIDKHNGKRTKEFVIELIKYFCMCKKSCRLFALAEVFSKILLSMQA